MSLYLVVTFDKNNAALVTNDDTGVQVHPFIYPKEVLLQVGYKCTRLHFEFLPACLQAAGALPFSNDTRNFWYQLNTEA